MEAETQFDLDDILCSNYTQTTGDDDDGKEICFAKTQVILCKSKLIFKCKFHSHFHELDVKPL